MRSLPPHWTLVHVFVDSSCHWVSCDAVCMYTCCRNYFVGMFRFRFPVSFSFSFIDCHQENGALASRKLKLA